MIDLRDPNTILEEITNTNDFQHNLNMACKEDPTFTPPVRRLKHLSDRLHAAKRLLNSHLAHGLTLAQECEIDTIITNDIIQRSQKEN